jgi:ribosomal protein S18 acetylase RimI-like enzyme
MPGSPARPPTFRAERYDLDGPGLWLSAIRADEARGLGETLAAIPPWSRYGTSAENLTSLFTPSVFDGGIRLAVRLPSGTAPIGVALIRHPWLAGPYMQFLAIAPAHQGKGYGRALLDWFARVAEAGGARNAWICAAAFNEGALRLYASCGYTQVTILEDLLKTGTNEVLMRRKLNPNGS